MATVKLILKQPYLTSKADVKEKELNPKETRLYIILIIDRKHVIKVKTEHVILPKEWDFKKQLKKEKLASAPEFNDDLLKLRKSMLEMYNKTVKDHPDWPFASISTALHDYGKTKEIPFKDNNKEFFQVLDEFIISMEGDAAAGTIKKFVTLKKSLLAFGKEIKKFENLTFGMIDLTFYDAYTLYLRNQKPRGRQKNRPEGLQDGLLNDTIGKYIECLKTFCKWAEDRKYNFYYTYKEFSNFTKANKKRKKSGKDIVTLSLQELKQFYSYDFSGNPTLEHVRDLFCFGAFTGQRWSDIERLEKTEIHGDVWSFTAFKTKKETEIDLTGYAAPALDILKKYDFNLPKISLTKFNLFIKNAAKIAGIVAQVKIRRYVGSKELEISKPKFEFLGSHTARKTCVSILLNNYNMNVTHVLQLTGHSDLKTLQKYINTDRKARREAMSKTKSITETLNIVKAG
jgi:integrase